MRLWILIVLRLSDALATMAQTLCDYGRRLLSDYSDYDAR